MKRLITALFFISTAVHAQLGPTADRCQQGLCSGYSAPVGACANGSGQVYTDLSTSPVTQYTCKNLVWVAVGSSGGGGTPGGSTGSMQWNSSGTFAGLTGAGIPKLNTFGTPTIAIGDTDYATPAGVTAAFTPTAIKTGLALSPNRTSGGTECYGDSLFSLITGVGDFGLSPQMCARLANDLLGPSFNYAVGGTRLSSIVDALFLNHQPNLSPTAVANIIMDGGVNEANFDGAGTGAVNNFQLELNAFVAWAELSSANRVMASVATPTGTWAASAVVPLASQVTGTARQSATNASTLTFSATGTGTKLGVTYYAPVAANGGTFTFSIDGTPQTDVCSGTTTFANTGCNAFAVAGTAFTVFRQEFTVASGAHTAVVTVTSTTNAANIVYISSVDQTPATKTNLPILIHAGVIRQQNDANPTITAAYNTAVQTVFSAMSWANTFFVDTRTGTPGVNATTDMASNGNTSPCPGGSPPLHPNKCGYDDWVTTLENTPAIAALNIFYPGLSTQANNVMGNQLVNGAQTATGVNTAQNYQSPLQTTSRLATSPASWLLTSTGAQASSSSLWTTPICALFGNVNCFDLSYDAATSSLLTAIISEFDMGFQYCPHTVATGGVTTGPAACSTRMKIKAVTGEALFAQFVPTGSAPTIAAGAAAGTTPTVSITGTNMAGIITVTTGTATTSTATLATVTFNGTLGTVPQGCTLQARNANAATLATDLYTTAPSTTAWTLAVGASAPTISLTHIWSYTCE